MKTILFIDKGSGETWSSYLELGYLLEGWRQEGLFEICPWISDGDCVKETVPSLEGILGDEQNWVAIVVADLRGDSLPIVDEGEVDIHYDNPYDFKDSYGKTGPSTLADSPHAIVRLCQMLGGLPIDQDPALDNDASTSACADTLDMIDRYRTGLARPLRIICVTPRSYDADRNTSVSRELSRAGLEITQDSGFWDRNGYPPMTRYVVFDWQEPAAALSEERAQLVNEALGNAERESGADGQVEALQQVRFWSGVLTLAMMDLPSAMLQPYRLYRMDVEVTSEDIKQVLSHRWSEWLAARGRIEEQVELERDRILRAHLGSGSMPVLDVSIGLKCEVDENSVFVDRDAVRLIRDRPSSDLLVWDRQRRNAEGELKKLEQVPTRALRNATREFREKSLLGDEDLEYSILTEDQTLDVEEDVAYEELRLAAETKGRVFATGVRQGDFAARVTNVEETIEDRARPQTLFSALSWVFLGSLLGVVACLASLRGEFRWSEVVVPVLVEALIVCITLIVILYWQRFQVRSRYDQVQSWMHKTSHEVGSEADNTSERLSSYAKVRRSWALINRQRRLHEPTQRVAHLKERLACITNCMQRVNLLVGEMDVDRSAYDGVMRSPWASAEALIEDDVFYYGVDLHRARRPLNPLNDGERKKVEVPFTFIRDFTLVPERVFDEEA